MAKIKLDVLIWDLFQRDKWKEARELLERERASDPDNHWLLTQLGVTFYEQRRYKEALPLFLASREIVSDCPLTLWNLAGTLDALGKHGQAIKTYTWLLESKKTSDDDPCWESNEWTESLKTDCVYRLALCFQKQSKKETADRWFRQYVDLLLSGIDGSYSIDDAMQHIRGLHRSGHQNGAKSELEKAVGLLTHAAGIEPKKGRRNTLPDFNAPEILSGSG